MEKESHIPSWDGSAKTWRRYTREVCWFVRSTPTHKRKYVATRLMGRLTGPARLLAMSWTHMNFDHSGGTKEFLQLLASSPLVRRSLPNAAAICQQYFSFRRHPGEPMHSFLVRESLGYSEFVEAILRLYEEKHGVEQHEKDFGLPDDSYEDWWDYGDWGDDENKDGSPAAAAPDLFAGQEERDNHPRDNPSEVPPGDVGSPAGAYQQVPPTPSPSRRSQAVQPSFDGRDDSVNELTLADSFVLGVLRGFRVLQAASLSPEDKRDILGTTRGSLEFDVVTQALQTLWDEQFMGKQSFQQHHSALHVDAYHDDMSSPYSAWWNEDFYADENGGWDDGSYWDHWDDWDGGAFQTEHFDHPPEETAMTMTPEDEQALKEAQQAEKMAESLAFEAQRSWSEAQKATQALRKDRGFGMSGATSSGTRGPCFICKGPHLASECPDRYHPGAKSFSKGKHNYMTEYEQGDNFSLARARAREKACPRSGWKLRHGSKATRGKVANPRASFLENQL